ncbi:MAG: lysophospholipid acyltransferase family protein, partial [Chloroflexota bacterium]
AKSIEAEKLQSRQPIRRFMKWLSVGAFRLLTDFEIIGGENFPTTGPLIVVGNHFSFVDPAALVRVAPSSIDFLGGAINPHAPKILTWIPRIWGFLPVYRGTGSKFGLQEAEKVINRGGILGIFPEAGNWANVLRPPRPGAAYLAAMTGAQILPVGMDGMEEVFPSLAKFRRAKVTVNIGKPFGPFNVTGKGRERREQINAIGDEMMSQIAALIPAEKRGHYSDDPAVREAAKGTEAYPWQEKREGEVEGQVM